MFHLSRLAGALFILIMVARANGQEVATTKSIEHVHWPDAPDVWMPYAPAIKVTGGTAVYLAGVTAAPVYHSHPHRPEEFSSTREYYRRVRCFFELTGQKGLSRMVLVKGGGRKRASLFLRKGAPCASS